MEKLKKALKDKGYTNYRLAKESKVGQATICQIISGKRKEIRLSTATKIANVLGVSTDELNKMLKE